MEAPTKGTELPASRHISWLAWLAVIGAASLLLLTCWWLGPYGPDPRNQSSNLIRTNGSPALNLPGPAVLERELTPEELAFGAEQVDRMVKDRPEMGRAVFQADALWQFCTRCFGGEAIGETVLWDSALPLQKGYEAENDGPSDGRKGYIRVRKIHVAPETRGQPLTCEELWSCAVFELENLRNHPACHALYEMALKGQLTREDWVRESSKLEYAALRRTAQDFRALWRPLARTRDLSETPWLWGVGCPPTYEAWILQYNDPNGYPWDAFARYYDHQIVPYLRSVRREVSR